MLGFDLLRILVIRLLLRSVRRALVNYAEKHHWHTRIRETLGAIDVALKGLDRELHERFGWQHLQVASVFSGAAPYMRHVKGIMPKREQHTDEPGSDDQMTDEQRHRLERQFEELEQREDEEEEKVRRQPTDGPG
jgi:hypothetical protein